MFYVIHRKCDDCSYKGEKIQLIYDDKNVSIAITPVIGCAFLHNYGSIGSMYFTQPGTSGWKSRLRWDDEYIKFKIRSEECNFKFSVENSPELMKSFKDSLLKWDRKMNKTKKD